MRKKLIAGVGRSPRSGCRDDRVRRGRREVRLRFSPAKAGKPPASA